MGLFDRFKDLTTPPAPEVHDGGELPPWLREAIPSPSRATNPPPPGVELLTDGGVDDPYRRAPARGAGSRLQTRASSVPSAPPGPVDMSSARAFSPPPAQLPASEYTPPATVYTPPASEYTPPASEYTPPATVYRPPPAPPLTAGSPSSAAPAPAAPSPLPTPAQTTPAEAVPWFAKTLPPDKQGGPQPWFAQQQGAPAPPPAPSAPAPSAPAPSAWTPPPAQPPPAPRTYTPAPRPQAPPSTAQLVDTLIALVLENWRGYPLEQETLSLLQIGLPYITQRDCSRDAVLAGQTAARLGYIARAAEYSEHPPTRRADEGLAEELLEALEARDEGVAMASGMAEFAADLALSEPVDPPASDRGPSWSLPGLDGSRRGQLREQLLKGVACPADITREHLQRTWKYGYFLRCMEEFFFDD